MVASSLKLSGWTLEEIINNGYHGFIDYVLTPEDWNHIQTLLDDNVPEPSGITQEDLDDTAECNYSQGLSDGGCSERENVRLRKLLDEKCIEY
jgi:hypothetical protein